MKVYVIANQKGGIGKTTTATALASILAERGYRTLFIDADKQGNSSDTYRADIEGVPTLYDVLLDDDRIPLADAIQATLCGDIVASDPLLRKADKILYDDVEGLYRLQDALQNLKGYDYVVIDTKPSIDAMLKSCLIACDEVIIPITADRYALQGLSQLHEMIQAIKRRQNPNLKIAGLLLVKYDRRTNLSKEVKESLERLVDHLDTRLFHTKIRESIRAREAQAKRLMLIQYQKNCTTAADYEHFVDELLKGE